MVTAQSIAAGILLYSVKIGKRLRRIGQASHGLYYIDYVTGIGNGSRAPVGPVQSPCAVATALHRLTPALRGEAAENGCL